MNRGDNCSNCGNEKEPGRKNQAFCNNCHSAYMKNNRSNKISVDVDIVFLLLKKYPKMPVKEYFTNKLKKKGYNAEI